MKKFKICILILTCLLSAAAQASSSHHASPSDDPNSWNIKLFNDSDQPRYYVVTDATFNPESHTEVKGTVSAGAQATIVLNRNEDHSAGRLFLSDKEIQYIPGTAPSLSGEYNFIEYNVGFDAKSGKPFTDYDVSAVDSLYGMPFTLEAVYKNGTSDGWVGISDDLSQKDKLSTAIKSFTDATGWPTFANSAKIPGAYNMFGIPVDQLSPSAAAMKNELLSRWQYWTTGTPSEICKNPGERSEKDCEDFARTVQSIQPAPLTNDLLAGLYGYVLPYNYPGSPYDKYVIALLRGLSFDGSHEDTNPAHLYPDYISMYCLNPFVTFIHKTLNLQVYAFSIDDSIGNIYQGDMQDLYIDLGSHANLPNKNAYVPVGPTPPSDFVLSYAPNWGGSKFVIGNLAAIYPKDQPGVVPFNLTDFDPNLHKLSITISKSTLVFSADITVDPATKVLTKANCRYNSLSDPLCNGVNGDWLGMQMNMDNINHAITLPPGK